MTAEIIVMNRTGIALAADSAVTVGARVANSTRKIYASAEKLYQLSFSAPVGIMIYGNASYQSLMWDTIIKEYRRKLGKTRFSTISDYATNFASFLKTETSFIRPAWRDASTDQLLGSLLLQIKDGFLKALPVDPAITLQTTDDISKAFLDFVKHVLEQIKKVEFIEGADDNFVTETKSKIAIRIPPLQGMIFEKLPISAEGDEILIEIAAQHLCRQFFGDSTSGIVVAGFGDDEYSPAVSCFELEESVLGLPRKGPTKSDDGSDSLGTVMPFAQKDAVYHFLSGVDQELEEFMTETTKEMMSGFAQAILDKVSEQNKALSDQISNAIKPVINQSAIDLFDSWNVRKEKFWQPVMNIVSILPKEELAAMAESLVTLTKFRRKITPTLETVGGPIDVAIITKGDGFVWMRRKHYFDPSLNPRVMARMHKGE